MDLGDRLYLAFTKQIRLLYEHWHLVTHCYCSELPRSSSNLVKKTAILYDAAKILSPDFFKKCQIQPISQVQWQITNFILEFKSTHPKCVNFDYFRVGSIYLYSNFVWRNVHRIQSQWAFTSKYWEHPSFWTSTLAGCVGWQR